MRICTKCKQEKDLDLFNRHIRCKFGRNPVCKECTTRQRNKDRDNGQVAKWAKTHRNTKEGYIHVQYTNMRRRVTGKQPGAEKYTGLPICSKEEYKTWVLGQDRFHLLWDEFVAQKKPTRLAPSVDRINTEGGYTLDNMQIITHSDNAKRSRNQKEFDTRKL